jgi:hypothetical protein
MYDAELIHSTADVPSALLYAMESGLEVMLDSPQPDPSPRFLSRTEVATMDQGCFYVFRPEWVFGSFQTSVISGGHNNGKYFVQPRTNFAPVTIYFSGERTEHGTRHFGAAAFSWHREWLEMPARIARPTPRGVQVWFKQLCAQVASGIVVKAGVHRYHVSTAITADPAAPRCKPPFDFIPWDEDVLRHPNGVSAS